MNYFLIKEFLTMLRVHHWLKNILVFLPLFLAHQFNFNSISDASFAFLSFCAVASLIYIINDIKDVKFDKLHATKSLRPIASGKISQLSLIFLIIILVCVAMALSLNLNIAFAQILFTYFCLALIYTYFLKKIIYLDLVILTFFYVIRIFAGGIAIDAVVTTWLITFSFFLFLSLAIIKRITEIQKYADHDLIQMGKSYTKKNLETLYALTKTSQGITLSILILYILIAAAELYSNNLYLLISVAILYLWFNRIVTATKQNDMKDDPIIFAIFDPMSYFSFFSIIFIFLLAI